MILFGCTEIKDINVHIVVCHNTYALLGLFFFDDGLTKLFDAFDGFSQNLMITLAEIEAMKKQVQSLLEENTALRLENDKLRTRLTQLEQETPVKSSKQGKKYIESIYHDGFHICNDYYGQRRENDEECMFCMEVLDRE